MVFGSGTQPFLRDAQGTFRQASFLLARQKNPFARHVFPRDAAQPRQKRPLAFLFRVCASPRHYSYSSDAQGLFTLEK